MGRRFASAASHSSLGCPTERTKRSPKGLVTATPHPLLGSPSAHPYFKAISKEKVSEKQHATALENMKAKMFTLALMPTQETCLNLLLPTSDLDRHDHILVVLSSLKDAVAEIIRTWEFEDATTSNIDIFSQSARNMWDSVFATSLFDQEASNDIAGGSDDLLATARKMFDSFAQAYLDKASAVSMHGWTCISVLDRLRLPHGAHLGVDRICNR